MSSLRTQGSIPTSAATTEMDACFPGCCRIAKLISKYSPLSPRGREKERGGMSDYFGFITLTLWGCIKSI